MARAYISIEGARQNNLKDLTLKIPLNAMTVVTGVSGSGKSSLAFDTVYSEGQRRYIETFSPYARQFLDRMDKPQVDRILGIPPAIAIDQTNPVRTSRSTVGTMTELNDHFKLLYARAADLYCGGCSRRVQRDSPEKAWRMLLKSRREGQKSLVCFRVPVPENFTTDEVLEQLEKQGYRRHLSVKKDAVTVIQDRVEILPARRARVVEALQAAFRHGQGRVYVYAHSEPHDLQHAFSADLHCPHCDLHYADPLPNAFSFNSPVGACAECRGFGRTIGIDYDLAIPDGSRTLAEGAVKVWQSKSYSECQRDMMQMARMRGIPVDVPWSRLKDKDREWVIHGEGEWHEGKWYGLSRFFDWLESRSYRMHVRVLLSRYRVYRPCNACGGARLKPESLLWRLGDKKLNMHELMQLPIEETRDFFDALVLPAPLDAATEVLVEGIRFRLKYLVDVGLGYLSLDRQSRTLSGGEVQRINLTTALGTSLVNTLFVLDEPSIGLHPRDIERLIGVLHRLRDAGNTLLVVEHDPDVIRAADRVVDMGPGPGERGGNIVASGTIAQVCNKTSSLTGRYLSGALNVDRTTPRRDKNPSSVLTIHGAAEHNLKSVDVAIPLERLVCITGVSGSGKSTLLHDVCFRGLQKLRGQASESPGRHDRITGHEKLADVVLVDQSPIGKTARSNPASYVGAFDAIRKQFAAQPLARERGYKPGTFSFNSGEGRCPACEGSGFERVEMQFLSDVYLRCPDCDGRRYRPDVLEVTMAGPNGLYSIADVLDMTVREACSFFRDSPQVLHGLEPLRETGLDYMKIGQPLPTLSGGESQRLKLAGHLAGVRRGLTMARGVLFLFDEPTTGLHFDDIRVLLAVFEKLVTAGNSVVVIEHNIDVIRCADWIIDLGPEGGQGGGRVVAAGPPSRIRACRRGHTGRALRGACGPDRASATTAKPVSRSTSIDVHHAREHNLRNISVSVPHGKLTVLTGVSGSGKSTIAFDILFAEGQRRYLESLNAYARQFVQPVSGPDVDALTGIPPTVAIEQRTSRGGWKSTVATVTEVYHFLRLLFVRMGTQYCPDCGVSIEPRSEASILASILKKFDGRNVLFLAPLVVARKGYYTDLAKWAAAKGFARLRVDGVLTPTDAWPRLDRFKDHDIELPVAEIKVGAAHIDGLRDAVSAALAHGSGRFLVAGSGKSRAAPSMFSVRRACPQCSRSFDELDPRLFSYNSKLGWCPECFGAGHVREEDDPEADSAEADRCLRVSEAPAVCAACGGLRLRPEALAVRFQKRNIAAYTALSVAEAQEVFARLRVSGREEEIARDVLRELTGRLEFLCRVGLGYLALDRAAPTLSGGESRRVRLAAQLGSNLRGVCYILDEPTIGLHTRDNRLLLDAITALQAKGNTVVVVEHDEDTIRRADYLVDLGPGGGSTGGRVVATGSVARVKACRESVTGRFLKHPLQHPVMPPRPRVPLRSPKTGPLPWIRVSGASLHNLKKVNARFPLNRLICVSGVSGSGKSTLVHDVLYENLVGILSERRGRGRGRRARVLTGCRQIEGAGEIRRLMEVDQTPIGKTPRSCPATYTGIWDEIRRLYAQAPESRLRGYGPGRFSFNVNEGRCAECAGQGVKKIEMSFLPDVTVPCDVCSGRRFNLETLDVIYNGKTVAEVLAMNVDDACGHFEAHPKIHHALALLSDVGLGYLTLGQQSPTLSGGEAQRIKLVTELVKAGPAEAPSPREAVRQRCLYLLDEPTVGLHMADVDRLIRVLHRLVDAGHTVIIIEHNLDIIAESDWIIDLGPEGGAGGGRIVAQGDLQTILESNGHTGEALRSFLKGRRAVQPKSR